MRFARLALTITLFGIAPRLYADAPPSATPAAPQANAPAPAQPSPLPAMSFYSSLASDDILGLIKANPAFSKLDKDLVGSPITLLVTHTIRPTAGGQAAGMFTAILSGSTLGLIPLVTNEQLVVRYEVILQGKPIATYSFERSLTRAQNLWTVGSGANGGLGKEGMAWFKSTATEFANKAANDPALAKLQDEINFYFPAKTAPPAG